MLKRDSSASYGVVRNPSTCYGGICFNHRWDSGQVPYEFFGSDFTAAQRETIQAGMGLVTDGGAGVSFRPRQSFDQSWVRFRDAGACSSYVGKDGDGDGGEQTIYLNSTQGCVQAGLVAHELNHALGLYHEQSRCDRDNYIVVHLENVTPADARSNFDKICDDGDDYLSYDETSIMHYAPTDFAAPGTTTISSLRGLDGAMGQRNALSSIDSRTLNLVYRPYSVQMNGSTVEGGYERVSWKGYRGALIFYVDLVQEYEECDNIAGWCNYTVGARENVGSTTQGTFLDTSRPYTGYSVCVHSPGYDGYYTATNYWYVVVASFPDGVLSGGEGRVPAFVVPVDAQCSELR